MRIAIIGAGPGGLCMGMQLKAAGFEDFVILEKATGVGGTWWHNRYPGAECDVKSHLYSFSFEPKQDWTRPFAGQEEIQRYLEACAEKHGLQAHLRLNTRVSSAAWDEQAAAWRLTTDAGDEVHAEIVVSAMGMFNEPYWPEIPGLDAFRGALFHSARWDHGHDLSGERVAVIGSAASAVQLAPEIASEVRQLHVYQRSANWILPKDDAPLSTEELERYRSDPAAVRAHRDQIFDWTESTITFSDPVMLQKAERAGLRALEAVEDPDVRRRLTPRDAFGCKRVLWSNHYYPMFNRANVELVTDPIELVTEDAIRSAAGTTRPVDTIVLATGFETTKFLSSIDVTGREGQRLDDRWKDGAQAYLGITTAGFPNLFMLYGPNTNNGSILFMLECQVAYVLQQLERMRGEGLRWIDVRREVMQRYNEQLQQDLDGIEVWQAACSSYYRSASGRIVTQWPHTMSAYRDRARRPDPEAYEVA
jgi:cation diffusion facilitator CzcD-associated flavoprotein CzcO